LLIKLINISTLKFIQLIAKYYYVIFLIICNSYYMYRVTAVQFKEWNIFFLSILHLQIWWKLKWHADLYNLPNLCWRFCIHREARDKFWHWY